MTHCILKQLPSTKCLSHRHRHPMLHDVLFWKASLNKSIISHCCNNSVFWYIVVWWIFTEVLEQSCCLHLQSGMSTTHLPVWESWDTKLLLFLQCLMSSSWQFTDSLSADCTVHRQYVCWLYSSQTVCLQPVQFTDSLSAACTVHRQSVCCLYSSQTVCLLTVQFTDSLSAACTFTEVGRNCSFGIWILSSNFEIYIADIYA